MGWRRETKTRVRARAVPHWALQLAGSGSVFTSNAQVPGCPLLAVVLPLPALAFLSARWVPSPLSPSLKAEVREEGMESE